MADHSKPVTTSTYANFVTELDGRFDDLAVGLDPAVTTATNLPTNSVRWNSALNKWQKWNGTTWSDLSSGYAIPISGGTIENTVIGATTRAAGSFTSMAANAPSNVTVNSASAALTVTQTGTGNALVVEDSASTDNTPFVIDSNGRVIIGGTSALSGYGYTAHIGMYGTDVSSASTAIHGQGTTTYPTYSRSGVGSTTAIVSNNDDIAQIRFYAADGAAFIRAAQITATIDGTPGTNDMPCRLVFSTTADGASTPTERMRIDSAGQIGIGVTTVAGNTVRIGKNVTGATGAMSVANRPTIQPDVTGSTSMYDSLPATAANGGIPYTVSFLTHYTANQGTFNADSTVTNQRGFAAGSALIGATNNFGFYGDIPSGTGRWNFYANGTAENYFAGNTYIGYNAVRAFTYAASPRFQVNGTSQSTSAISAVGFSAALADFSGALLLGRGRGTQATPVIVNSGDEVGRIQCEGFDGTNLIPAARIIAEIDGTPGTNDMPGRLRFFTTADGASTPTERLRLDSTGAIIVGSGEASATTTGATVRGPARTGTDVAGVDLTFEPGNGTGTAGSGALSFRTAPASTTGTTANTLTERLRIAKDGTSWFGGSVVHSSDATYKTQQAIGVQTSGFQVLSTDNRNISIIRYTTGTTGNSNIYVGKVNSATIGTFTAVTAGHQLGIYGFVGSDGSALAAGASILGTAAGTWSGTANPTYITLNTATVSGTTPIEGFRVTESQSVIIRQAGPADFSASATLTTANIDGGLITKSGTSAVTLTLPTGTNMETLTNGMSVNSAIDWSIINTNATGAVTVGAGTGHTIVGSATVAVSTSGMFRTRKTATNTFITYRIS